MHVVKWFVPGIVLLLVTVAAALPWGVPSELRLVLPLLPVVAMHAFIASDAAGIEDWLVFLAGIVTDVLGQGPIGYWALVYLAGFVLLRLVSVRGRGFVFGASSFALVVAQLAVLQWVLASVYYLRAMSPWPLIMAAIIAVLINAIVIVLTSPTRRRLPHLNARLERGS